MADLRVSAVKFVYFISGLVIGALIASFLRASHYGNWTSMQTGIALAAGTVCVLIMIVASRQFEGYIDELRHRKAADK